MLKHLEQLKENILKWVVASVIIIIPLYPKFPFIKIPGTYVSIRIEDFLILVLFIVWLSTLNRIKIKYFFTDKVYIAILLFWVVTLISTLSGIFLTKTVVSGIGVLNWARRVEYMIMFFIGNDSISINNVKNKTNLSFYIKCLIIVILFVFLFGLGQKYLNWPVITTQNSEYSQGVALRYTPGGHLISTFAGHYDLAAFIILVSPLFYLLLFYKKSNEAFLEDPFKNLLLLISIISGFWLLVNAASRISIVSYLISVSLSLVLIRKYKYIPLVLIISLIFISYSTNLISRYSRIFDVTIEKITGKPSLMYVMPEIEVKAQEQIPAFVEMSAPTPTPPPVFEDRSTSIRLNVEWPRALRAFTKNPIIGTGFSSITLATDNDYLRMIGEVGLLGLISFLLILVRIFKSFLKSFKPKRPLTLERVFLIGVMSMLPGIFLNAFFIDIFEASKFAIILWLILGMAYEISNR
jgi:hypothetical protein